MNYVNTTFSIDGIIEHCQAYQLGTGGFTQKGYKVVTCQGTRKVKCEGQVFKKPTAAHPGYQPSTTQWGTWPQDHSVLNPGRPLVSHGQTLFVQPLIDC